MGERPVRREMSAKLFDLGLEQTETGVAVDRGTGAIRISDRWGPDFKKTGRWTVAGRVADVPGDFGSFEAAVDAAYAAKFHADPGRVETSPVDLLRAGNARLKAELAAIHKAMRDGADDALWPPGSTVAEAVARLVRLPDAVSYALQERV